MKWLDSTDLKQWAARRDAQSRMPQVVRRLIHATGRSIHRITLPAGDAVQIGGWDGIVEVGQSTPFIPGGASVWEFGASDKVKTKADGDFDKRTANPRGVDPQATTFVFVTPRVWEKKDAWAKERRDAGPWKEVLAYDARTIEEWLERAPPVASWLARLIGKRPKSAWDLEHEWDEWRCATNPNFDTRLTVAGRVDAANAVQAWLSAGGAAPFHLRASTRSEAVAFFCAAVLGLPEDQSVDVLSRTVFVSDADAWRQLGATLDPLVLVPMLRQEDMVIAPAISQHGHRVFIPLDARTPPTPAVVELGLPDRDDLRASLREVGVEEDRATRLVSDSGRSIPALRRLLSPNTALAMPAWAEPANAAALVPLLLCGCFDSRREGDRAIVETITGSAYRDAEQTLARWAAEADAPVVRRDSLWCWVARRDAWAQLCRFLARDVIVRFGNVAVETLASHDPKFDLPATERWAAAVHGKVRDHSDDLRRCLAETILLLALTPVAAGVQDSSSPAQHAEALVRRVLHERGTTVWAGLTHELPLLAEAAPTVFLDAVEADVDGGGEVCRALFREENVWGGSPHTGLLWALECLAWSPEHLSRTAMVLARIAEMDPGGKLSNRPLASLAAMFLPWLPQAAGDDQERAEVVGMLAKRRASVARTLLLALLPRGMGTTSNIYRPRWREWNTSKRIVTTRGYFAAVERYADIALALTDSAPEIWPDLLARIEHLPPTTASRIQTRLNEVATAQPSDEVAESIRRGLRRFLHWHRSYPEHDAARPEEELAPWQAIYDALEPSSPVLRYRWLFRGRPDHPGVSGKGWRAEDALVAEERRKAVALLAEGGAPQLLELARSLADAWTFGVAVGAADLDESLLDELVVASITEGLARFDLAIVRTACGRRGPAWRTTLFARLRPMLDTNQAARLLMGLAFEPATWELAASDGHETKHAYWAGVEVRLFPDDVQHATPAAEHLMAAGRGWAALDMVGLLLQGALLPTSAEVTRRVELDGFMARPHPSRCAILGRASP